MTGLLPFFKVDWAGEYLSHGLTAFQEQLSLNRSRNILIVGSGVAAVYLAFHGLSSYKKAQRRYLLSR